MLTPLQEQVARIVAGLEEASDFALAGGAALIARGDVQRETRDLDFFGLTTEADPSWSRRSSRPSGRQQTPPR